MTSKFSALAAASGLIIASFGSSAAWADTIPQPMPQAADGNTLSQMEAQCDALAMGYDNGNGDRWSGAVVLGAATLIAGPTEIDGTRVIDESTIQHAGDYVPATLEIRGDPFRVGGSVNMFGDQWSTAGYWTDSTYFYDADFNSTFRFDFQCEISQEVYHPEVHTPVQGHYVNNGTNPSGGQGSCAGLSPANPHWGQDIGNCTFIKTGDAVDQDEYWDPPVVVATLAGTPVDQEQTDNLRAFEDHGGPVQVTGEFKIGKVVICISPSGPTKKGNPGEWRQQNGYTGDKCTTDWFQNHAVWGSGTDSSNGTYISVPNYVY